MAEGASRERWLHTSVQVWIVAETKRNKKKRSLPFEPNEFNPWERRSQGSRSRGTRLTVGVLLALKGMFDAQNASQG